MEPHSRHAQPRPHAEQRGRSPATARTQFGPVYFSLTALFRPAARPAARVLAAFLPESRLARRSVWAGLPPCFRPSLAGLVLSLAASLPSLFSAAGDLFPRPRATSAFLRPRVSRIFPRCARPAALLVRSALFSLGIPSLSLVWIRRDRHSNEAAHARKSQRKVRELINEAGDPLPPFFRACAAALFDRSRNESFDCAAEGVDLLRGGVT